ncbi:MAG: ADP-glyceromanno-heptose 6-epimerase [Alphaproteobacteria bacterium]
MQIVTGGAGFIGSNIVKALEDRGFHDTVICDWLGTDHKWQNIAKREVGSIIQPQELFQFLNQNVSRIDTIFHMGAISSTTETDADAIITNNFRLSQGLWSWCSIHKKRFIYASSAATYGGGKQGFIDDETPEFLSHLRPLNAYGWSKHLFDRWVARVSKGTTEAPTQCVGLKFFNVYGPNEYHKGGQRSVVEQAFGRAQAGEAIKLFKSYTSKYRDGDQLRDFIYVKDCVDVAMWFFDNPDAEGLYNVGTGEARTFNHLAEAVFAALKLTKRIEYIDMPETLRTQYQNFTQAEMNKLRGAGYNKMFTSLEEGVEDYIKNFLNTADPYL